MAKHPGKADEPGSKKAAKKPKPTRAMRALTEADVAFEVHRYEPDPDAGPYGVQAAAELGADPRLVLRVLVTEADGGPLLGIVPVSSELDLEALAAAVGAARAEAAGQTRARKLTGYPPQAISPFGQRSELPAVVDVTVLDFPRVFVSGGKPGVDIELDPRDLVRAANARTAPIARWDT